MLIYVAGPYSPASGEKDIDKNIAVAMGIAKELWIMGHTVICPHGNSAHLDNDAMTNSDWVTRDLNMVAMCDAMVMVPGWEESSGSVREQQFAEYNGIPVFQYPEMPPLHPTEVRCPEQAFAFRALLGQMYRTHLRKNADYSPANIAGTGTIGLVTRLWDKMARIMNLSGFKLQVTNTEYTAPKQANNEAIEDTFMDMAVYALIALLYKAGKWGR
jgi:hypothetical protein